MSAKHGTYAGWSRHQRHGETPCLSCKEAQRQYMANRRKQNPDIYAAELADHRARVRALWRLAKLHPGDYGRLVAEEKAKDRVKVS